MPSRPSYLPVATVLLSAAFAAACTASSGGEPTARMTAQSSSNSGSPAASSASPSLPEVAQLIVKFRDPAARPGDPAFLQKLTAAAQVTSTEFVRQMSGGAYVLRIACAAGCAPAIARLRASDWVEYVEPDSIQHHQ